MERIPTKIIAMGQSPNAKGYWGLTFTAEEANSTVSMYVATGSPPVVYLSVSYDDGSTWQEYTLGTTLTLSQVGDKVSFSATNGHTNSGFGGSNYVTKFQFSGKIAASGDISSLLLNDKNAASNITLSSYCYRDLFSSTNALTSPPLLPATKLASSCYMSMFQYNTSITYAPDLPAQTLTNYCYESMFSGCTTLTQAPTLGAQNLSMGCYRSMFAECTSLVSAPSLPALSLVSSCYEGMFRQCTSLTTPPLIAATSLNYTCFSSMFMDCTSLLTAPALPYTTLYNQCYRNMFKGCTALTTPPALPASSLAAYCYQQMFADCTGLLSAPSLPATTVSNYSYDGMFSGCTALTSVPTELSATTIGQYGCRSMFAGCTSLTKAPELPATTLSTYCYAYMFNGCTSLITPPPSLPAPSAPGYCYEYMFQNCTSLTYGPDILANTLEGLGYQCYWMFNKCTSLIDPPALPLTTIASSCYRNMFTECTALTESPILPAAQLQFMCYSRMFWGCTHLNYVVAGMLDWQAQSSASFDPTADWLNGVAANGTFKCLEILGDNNTIQRGVSRCPSGWTVENVSASSFWGLSFTAEQANSTIKLKSVGFPASISLVISQNYGFSWGTYTIGEVITLSNVGDSVFFKAASNVTNTTLGTRNNAYYQFEMTGGISAGGDISSLLLDDSSTAKNLALSSYCYAHLFDACTVLTTPPELPSMQLASSCYRSMFYACDALVSAPALPAVTLKSSCYANMFGYCSSLTTAPHLPATTLVTQCYSGMFRYCSNLSSISVGLTSWTGGNNPTQQWVNGVSATGTFTCPTALGTSSTITRGVANCPANWTVVNT